MKLLTLLPILAISFAVHSQSYLDWKFSSQKGDFGEASYNFAHSNPVKVQLTGVPGLDYWLKVSVGKNLDSGHRFVYVGGDSVESLAMLVDRVEFTFDVGGSYEKVVATGDGRDGAFFVSSSYTDRLIELFKKGSRVQVKVYDINGSKYTEGVIKLQGSTKAINRL